MYPSPLGLIVFLIMGWLVWLMISQAIEDHKRRKVNDMVSIGTMVKQLEGLCGTTDVSEWEEGLITTCVEAQKLGRTLSEKQVTKIEQIWIKHFA